MARSRVTNGKKLLPLADGRSVWARLFADCYAVLLSHCGGASIISEPRRMLCRRAALYETELLILENRMAELRSKNPREISERAMDLYSRLTNSQRRVLEAIGINRVARPIQNLSQYIEATYGGGDKAQAKVEDVEVVE